MGTDDLFKKRREERKRRDYGFKQPRANSFLIVTEGKKTEPLYFKGMQKLIEERIGGTINVVEIPLIDIFGEGIATGMNGVKNSTKYFNSMIWEMECIKRMMQIFLRMQTVMMV